VAHRCQHRAFLTRYPEAPRAQVCSPASLAPLGQVRPFDPEVGVAAVAGVDHGVVRQYVEHALLQVVYERGEVLWTCCPSRTPREAVVAVQQGQSVALGFPPCTYAELAPSIARLQVSGTELERMGWGGNDRMARLCLVVNESLGMSTGKTAAQAAHALFAWYLQADHVQRFWWVQVDMPLHITGAPQAEFDRLVPQSEVVITDAGRTETAPGTATVLALSLDTSDGPGSAPVRSGAANNKDHHPNGSR